MGWFQDVFDQFDKLAQPWKIKKSDINNSSIGQPLHAFKLMESAFRTTDPIRQTVHTFRNIRDHGLVEGMKQDIHEKGHQNEDWVKNNKAAIIAVATYGIGSYLGVAGSAGSTAGGAATDAGLEGSLGAADALTATGAVGDAAGAAVAGDVATTAGTTLGSTGLGTLAGESGYMLDPVISSAPHIAATGGGLAGYSAGAGIAGQIGMNMVKNGADNQTIKTDANNAANDPANGPSDPSVTKPVINTEGGGMLSKAGNLLESKTGQSLIGLAGNALVGAAQGNETQARIDANTAKYTYNANQWRDPAQLAALKQSVVGGPGVSTGYLDRARQVSNFLNSRQINVPSQPGDPRVVYGTDVRGQ